MQNFTVSIKQEHRKPKGSNGEPQRKHSGTHMPVVRRNVCHLLPTVMEDGETQAVSVEIRFDAMDRPRRNNNGLDVADISELLSRQNDVNSEESEEKQDEPLPKYGSADEFYELVEEIGKGAYGIVRKCVDKRSKHECAAKIVKTSNSKVRKETMREIELMIKLGSHEKLVGLLDAYHTPFEIVMVLELVSGGELFERIVEEDYLMEEDAIDYVRQVLEGLKYMHSKDIVHLDLKPENILCVSKECMNIKLVDFGLAQQLKEGEDIKSSYGTPDFVAPEVIRMKPISKASDLWSLGVVTYVLLSGLMPFSGDNDKDTLIKVAKAEWDFDDDCFDELSEEAKDFIEDLLEKEPSDRLTIEECLVHPWIVNQKKVANKIDTVKHKSFLAKRRWKKSINALVAVRRISSLLPGLANRRPSMDTAIEAARKAGAHHDSEERKNSVPTTFSLGKTDTTKNGLCVDNEEFLDVRRPRSNTVGGGTHLTVDGRESNLGMVNDNKKYEDKKNNEINNNDSRSRSGSLQHGLTVGKSKKESQFSLPHDEIVLKIDPKGLKPRIQMESENERSTKGLDLAISDAKISNITSSPNKFTVHLNSNFNSTSDDPDNNERIPSIVLNDEDSPMSPDMESPASSRRISSDNYFISHETIVDSSTYIVDSWSIREARPQTNAEHLNNPDSSKVCIRTVDQKGQTITVKLDGFSSVELPANKSTCSQMRRASTGSEAIEFFQPKISLS